MKHTFSSVIYVIIALIALLPGVFLANTLVVSFTFNSVGKVLTLNTATDTHTIQLTTGDSAFLSNFLLKECTKPVEVSIVDDFPLPNDSFTIIAPGGYTGTLKQGATPKRLIVSSTYTAPTSSTAYITSAVPTFANSALTIPIQATPPLSIVVNPITSDPTTFSTSMTKLSAISGVSAGIYIITDSSTKYQYILSVTTPIDATLLVAKKVIPWYNRYLDKGKRPSIFLATYALFVCVMTFTVKTLDHEMYVLGGGFLGILSGSNVGEENFVDEKAADLMATDETENLPTGRSSRSRPDSSTTGTSDITSSMTESGQGEETFGEQDGSEEAHEKTDARSASLMAAVVATALLFLF